jgi:hypothetical protein
MLEETSRMKWDFLQAELKEREAYFAQSEILRFVQSNRRQFNPLNVARAMAGLPVVTTRVSCERCAKHGIDPPPGMAYCVFQAIRQVLREPIRDLGRSVELMREHIVRGPNKDLPHAVVLRKNWYFLEPAIRSAVLATDAPRGFLPFLAFAEYTNRSTRQRPRDLVLAGARRIILEGEMSDELDLL